MEYGSGVIVFYNILCLFKSVVYCFINNDICIIIKDMVIYL